MMFLILIVGSIIVGLTATSCGTVRTHAGINHEYEYNFDDGYYDNRHKFEVGLKMGTGLNIFKHYYVGVHYVAGLRDVYKVKGFGGRNKTWSFVLGYDF